MRRAGWIILAAGAATVALSAAAPSAADARRRNQILENELSLARLGGSYMIIDLPGKAISLKARGMVLRKWEISGSRFWGRPLPMKTLKLKAKSALRTPQRTNITPGKEEAKTKPGPPAPADVDLGVLELKNMPVHFDLAFDGQIRISVRPRVNRIGTRIMNLVKSLRWYAWLPMKTVWRTIRKNPFTEVELVLPAEKDAQGLYWAFLDKQNTLIIPK